MARPWPVLLMARELGLGGTERQLAETAMALDREVFEPHAACFRGGGFRARELREAGVPVLELGVRSLISGSALRGALLLRRYLCLHRIRLVHTFDVPMDLFGAPAARFFGVPVVLSSQRAHRALTPGLTRHLLRVTDRMVNGIVVNSQSVARELQSADRVAPSLIRVAYNGVDTRAFSPAAPAASRPWPDAQAVIGVVCALRPEKGLPLLLEAFGRVRGAYPGARLLIVGGGPALGGLRDIARSLHLESVCRFEPAVQNVAEWLRAIDIFVLPSLSEAFSNSLMEAMACGCCVIASDAGGNPELVDNGETGLLFRAGDSAALASRLAAVLADAARRLKLGAAAACRMRERFSREAAVRRMGGIYLEFLEGR